MSSKSNFFRQASGANLFIGGGGGGGSINLPAEPEPIEEVTTITDDAASAKRRKKKGIRQGGRASTVLSGITSALKKRLGE